MFCALELRMGFHLVRKECIAKPLKLLAHVSSEVMAAGIVETRSFLFSFPEHIWLCGFHHCAWQGLGLGWRKVLLRKDLTDSSLQHNLHNTIRQILGFVVH